jgi:glucosamine kinase
LHETTLFLGIDGGGTTCRARLSDAAGRVLGEGTGGSANIRFGVSEGFEAALSAARLCFGRAGLREEDFSRTVACLGFAGATEPATLMRASAHPHPFRQVIVTADAQIACLGAHEGRDGGVIVVGTGTCGWAVVGERQHRVGGWGFPISDEGSGAWLGFEAIRRTLWAHDGHRPWTEALSAIFRQFGSDPHRIVAWATTAKPRDFAALAPVVVEHARKGDATARDLMRWAGVHLDVIATALVDFGAPRVALLGGLAPHVREWLAPDTVKILVEPAGDALDGALWLARTRAGAGRSPEPSRRSGVLTR